MKFLCVLLLFIPALFFGDGIKFSAGLTGGYDLESRTFTTFLKTNSSMSLGASDSIHCYNFGIFFDLTYFRFLANYSRNFFWNDTILNNTISSPSVPSTNLTGDSISDFTTFDFSLLFKYPISIMTNDQLSVWPAAGFQYSLAKYFFTSSGYTRGSSDYNQMNDFFMIIGVGADYYLKNNVFVTGFVHFDWNLTPLPTDAPTSQGYDYSAYSFKLSASIGFGYTF